MEPQVRYARTSDGMNIAYAVVGQGPPLDPWVDSHAPRAYYRIHRCKPGGSRLVLASAGACWLGGVPGATS
jgi:hypothetical protein